MDNEFNDLVSERALLSIICNFPNTYIEISDKILKEDLWSTTNQMLFDCISNLLDKDPDNLDQVSIRNQAIELGYTDYDSLTDKGKYIEAIFVHKINSKNLEQCARRIKDLAVKRKLLSDLNDMQEAVLSSVGENKNSINLISEFEEKLASTTTLLDNRNKISLLGDGLLELLNQRADNPTDQIGLPTGLQRFDLAIGGGLRRGATTLVGARAKNFKSGFALNIARSLAVDGIYKNKQIPVLILDTELNKEYEQFRFAASLLKIPIDILERGQWRSNVHIVNSIENIIPRIAAAPIHHIYVGGFSIDKIISIVKWWLVKFVKRDDSGTFNDCLVIYDYIKLMDSKELKNDLKEWQVLGFHLTALNELIIRSNIPLLCMCQLNREGADTDDDTVFAGADRLVWFASNICILRNKRREEIEQDGLPAGNMRIKVITTRYGAGMDPDDYLNLRVNKACMFLEEGKLKSELPRGQEVGVEEADQIENE